MLLTIILFLLGLVASWLLAVFSVEVSRWTRSTWQQLKLMRPGHVQFKVTNCQLVVPEDPPLFPERLEILPNKPYALSRKQYEALKRRAPTVTFEVL